MTKLNEKRVELASAIPKICCDLAFRHGFDAALAELMPQVQKLVGALELYSDSVSARQALTEWQEYVGKE